MIELDYDKVKFITLYTGTKGYHNCYCKCPCCTQKNINDNYQGQIEQIEELFNKFKSIKQMYILGNPDPLVDVNFCNEVSKLSILKGANVCYSTSGVGGLTRIKQLIQGIDIPKIDYISFSIDSINPQKMSMLKGINYPFNSVIEAINWLIKNNYPVKIQPTLWSANYQEAFNIIEYFANLGVKLFTFHIGSNETAIYDTHHHLTEEQVKYAHLLMEKAFLKYHVNITCPIIYPSCGNNDLNKWYCMQPEKCENLLVFLKEDGVYVTNVPIISEIDDSYLYNINKPIMLKQLDQDDICPISNSTAKTKTLCRYVKKNWS